MAVVVYEKAGLGILRRGWFNLDIGWSLLRVGSGALTLFSPGGWRRGGLPNTADRGRPPPD
ncbi:MAG: hypothetical protein M3Z98_00455 [Candidatus Dormibacteraeota bacterium]|nr:hypothetical protein [Candidatus Dormibacteraeota bacterium]